MKVNAIRKAFLEYFKRHEHKVLHSSPLVPQNDPSLLFTNAGMVPFKNYFTGAETPTFTKATTSQKCVRAGGKHNDLENVGYTARHHTFFEMLGNFSFGDYFKEDAIHFAWDFLTNILSIPKDKLWITVYHTDDEAFNIWKKLTNFPDDRIIKIDTDDNFWAMGDTGPCGPCSEIFYDHGPGIPGGLPGTDQADGDRYVEIWNLVFMQYEKLADGTMKELPNPSIDTGMGIERIASVMQGVHDNYEIDLFKTLIASISELSNNFTVSPSHKVVADHLRSISFLIADGVMPSNEGRGYVLRRIMRRGMRHLHQLGCKETSMYKLVDVLIKEMADAYPELLRAEANIKATLRLEEDKFRQTLDRGLKVLNAELKKTTTNQFSGEVAFKLYDTYGFPLDLTTDILRGYNIQVDIAGFEKEMQKQKQAAKAAWKGSGEKTVEEIWYQIYEQYGATEFLGYSQNESVSKVVAIVKDGNFYQTLSPSEKGWVVLNQTPFYAEAGGQVGDKGFINQNPVADTQKRANQIYAHYVIANEAVSVGDEVTAKIDTDRRQRIKANHSATHLLHYALRKALGEHVVQKGSLVEEARLRFDFTHHKPLTEEEIKTIEQSVNKQIMENEPALAEIMPHERALDKGAMALFGEKYGDEVRVVQMGDTIELCGGTHVARTGDIGSFKITSEEGIASGIRRIEAITGIAVINYLREKEGILNTLAANMKCPQSELIKKSATIIEDKKGLERKLEQLQIENAINTGIKLEHLDNINIATAQFEGIEPKHLKNIADRLSQKHSPILAVITSVLENRVSVLVYVSDSLTLDANALLKEALGLIEGKGGGRKQMAQAGGSNVSGVQQAIEAIVNKAKELL